MKKIVALLMLVAMMLSTVAFAEPTLLADFGDENTLVYAREIAYEADTVDALGNAANRDGRPTSYAHVTLWAGEWQLVAAYVAEAGIEEFDLDAEPGYYAVTEGVILNLVPLFNNSANHANGVMADQAAYLHAHAYDLEGTLTMPESIDDAYEFFAKFDAWEYGTVRSENDADMNFGPIKLSFKKGDDDFLYWNALTGFNFEEIEEFKYMGMNANGQIVVCSASKNVVTSEKAEIYFAYIFEPVVAEEVAE